MEMWRTACTRAPWRFQFDGPGALFRKDPRCIFGSQIGAHFQNVSSVKRLDHYPTPLGRKAEVYLLLEATTVPVLRHCHRPSRKRSTTHTRGEFSREGTRRNSVFQSLAIIGSLVRNRLVLYCARHAPFLWTLQF